VAYTPADQAEAADELARLPPQSELSRFMIDYGALRAMARACAAAARQ
jgi:hypothetical protein